MKRSKGSYYSQKQIEFLQAPQKRKVLVGGRGSGKTTCIAYTGYRPVIEMPGSRTFFSSSTFGQILQKTLPAIEKKWREWGLKKGLHYVVGKKPPSWFKEPIVPIAEFKNTVSFINGSYIEMLSMDRPDLARGGSYDGGNIDEAALVKEKHYHDVILPSVRDNERRFRAKVGNLLHRISFYTSIPRKSSGMWLLDYEDKAEAYPDDYFFMKMTALDLIEIHGESWIEERKREMTYESFMIEIMNELIEDVPNKFYNRYDSEKHSYMRKYKYKDGEDGISVTSSSETFTNDLVEVSFDFGGWINCATLWQESKAVEHCINAFHVKEEGKLPELVDKICDFLDAQGHQRKYVRVWGEPRGHDRRSDNEKLFEQVRKLFMKRGWTVEIKAHAGRTTNHRDRQTFMDIILSEEDQSMPKMRLSYENCADVDTAIRKTGITSDFKKDKSSEKDRDFPQEHATHYTDTVDYYFVQKHGWRLFSNHNWQGDYGVL